MSALVLAVVAPGVAAAVGTLVGRARQAAAFVAVAGAFVALAAAFLAALQSWRHGGAVDVLGTVETGAVPIVLAVRDDPLAATVALMVAVVAAAVQVYSTRHLADDSRYGSYAALVSLFTAAMLLVVASDDLLVLLVGWEVMGICSALLIGHHWEKREARDAAVKAFVVTHLGDAGLLFGIFALGVHFGSFRVSVMQDAVAERGDALAGTALTVALLLVLGGVIGKSAQFPLHVWLPDAMAGPSPVSALIHAATMVAAGVFLVARLYDVFLLAPAALAVLAVVAAVTMLGAALAALAQEDLKRVLAYSTGSQLAYMFGGLAVGGYDAGLLHLVGHAAFKALLFLCVGAVAQSLGTTLLAGMGGLRLSMPVTFWTATAGFAALAGVLPLGGALSKESVISAAENAALHGGVLPRWAAWVLLASMLATVFVTAAYAGRAWLRAFCGPPRRPAGTPRPLDPPAAMTVPLVVLTVPTLALGVLLLWPDGIAIAFSRSVGGAVTPTGEAGLSGASVVVTSVLVVCGLLLAFAEWRRVHGADPAVSLGRLRSPLATGFGVGALYEAVVVRPTDLAARAVVVGDRDVLGAYVRGSGRAAQALGRAVRAAQTGNVQTYLTGVLAGAVVLGSAAATVLR